MGSHSPQVFPVHAGDADLGLECSHEGGNVRLEALLLGQHQIASHCRSSPHLRSHTALLLIEYCETGDHCKISVDRQISVLNSCALKQCWGFVAMVLLNQRLPQNAGGVKGAEAVCECSNKCMMVQRAGR